MNKKIPESLQIPKINVQKILKAALCHAF